MKALGAIEAKAIVMPASTDLYFPPADNAFEVKHMPNATLRVVETDWGHCAGGPGTSPTDIQVLDEALKELLRSGWGFARSTSKVTSIVATTSPVASTRRHRLKAEPAGARPIKS